MWNRTTYETWESVPAYGTGTGIGGAVYVVIGVFVALAHHYFAHLISLGRLISALLAVVLWPLLLLGIHVHLG